ncbi:MAG: T9SS type A sorting domain-containing protein [Bacteroidia bacterium]
MQKGLNYFFVFWSLMVLFTVSSFTTVAQCVVDSGVPSVPGIYPPVLNDANGCEFYEMDVTFFLPRDTTVLFAGQTLTFPFNYFRIDSIAGLPQGLSWQCNNDSCVYFVHPDSANVDTLGCIRIFGTPATPGFFPITVYITANVIIFNTPGDQPGTYTSSLKVGPCPFVGDCYTYNLSSFCEPAVLDLTNNIPSNGHPGFSYAWHLSGPSGTVYNTSDEDPFPQVLGAGGDYILSYSATVDTTGYFLNSVVIDSVNCSDLIDAGDLYWILKDPSGNTLVNTSATPITNGGASLPLSTGIANIALDTGVYEFQVWDADQIGNDDGCATNTGGSGASVFLTVPPLNSGVITVVNSGLRVKFTIDHPVQVITCTDTIHVDSLPAIPGILADTNRVCLGDSLLLSISTKDSVQWYLDGNPIQGENDTLLMAGSAGNYFAEIIDRNTYCTASTATFQLLTVSIPAPSIAFDGSFTMTIASPNAGYNYQWYNVDGTSAGTGSSWMPTTSGNYYAVAVDQVTGCESGPSATIRAILSAIDRESAWVQNLRLYPNPAKDRIQIEGDLLQASTVFMEITDLIGRSLYRKEFRAAPGHFEQTVLTADFTPGVYILRWVSPEGSAVRRFVIEQ